jgi:ribosomal protein L22
MSPEEKDPKDAPEETPEATEKKPKPKPKRKPTAKKPAKSAADVEKEVSEEAAKSIPRGGDDDDADVPAPAEESSEAAAVEASVAEEGTEKPAKPRGKKADDDDDAPTAEDTPATQRTSSSSTGKKETPKRKRDQPRERQPGEAPVLVHAKARYVRTSARKARLVCDHIRGKDVEQARAILSFTPRGAAKPWMKLLESAIANAEHNHELVGDELKIASVHADEGPTLKRYRPRAMGRATRIRKRTSHLSITLTPKE